MRVLSWNIQWGRGADGMVSLPRIIDIVSRLGPTDVICLQEVATNFRGLAGGHGEDGVAIFREAFPEYTLVQAPGIDLPAADGGRSLFGNLMLSRLRVGSVSIHRLPWPPVASVPSMPRTAIEAVVYAHRGAPVRIVTTHLEYYAEQQRGAQIDYLRQLQIEAQMRATMALHPKEVDGPFARHDEPLAALACGDFNFQPESDHWHRMVQPHGDGDGWFDAWQIANPSGAHPPSVGVHGAEWPDRPYCCDFFFVSAVLRPAVQRVHYDALSAASDHQPLVLDVDDACLRG